MLFSEIYGTYFRVMEEILNKAKAGTLTRREMTEIIRNRAFEESVAVIPQALESESWPLLDEELRTPLSHPAVMGLTELEKRWLRTLLDDPRIALFDVAAEGLEDVSPLYPKDALVYFDQYSDGDPYDDPKYQEHFKVILRALHEKRKLKVVFQGRRGRNHWTCVPYRLEYSAKDDKFRLFCERNDRMQTINLGRIRSCQLLEPFDAPGAPIESERLSLTLELIDERNALERVMLHFSHLEKEARQIDGNRYQLKLQYRKDDETEILIRVLSFGPIVKVVAPQRFVKQMRRRIQKQKQILQPQE